MKYVITDFGSKITITAKEDPYLYNLMQTATDKAVNKDDTVETILLDVLEVLYYGAEIGYACINDVHVFPIIAPDFEHECCNMLIPSPALTYMFDLQEAGMMLEKFVNAQQLHVEVFQDEDFQDMYESLLRDESDEEDVFSDDESNMSGDTQYDDKSAEQYIHVDNIKQFYKLNRGSEMFKYKKFAKAFYRLGDNYFMDAKPNVVLKDETMHLQNVDITYATKIPLKDIKLR